MIISFFKRKILICKGFHNRITGETNVNKKLVAVLAIVVIAIASVAAWWFLQMSVQKASIRYGGQYYPGEFLLFGHPEFWTKYGLTVEHTLFSSGAENNEALIAGKIDINCGADSKTIALFNAIPYDALIIGTVQRGNRYTTIVRVDSDYDSWDDLIGKKVATRFGTGAEGVLRRFYNQTYSEKLGRNYRWEDFDYVNLKVEDMIAALDAGQIEAFTAWEPTPAIAEAQGVGRVLRTYGDIALVPASIHTTKEFAYNHRDLVVKFLAAQLDKAEMIKTNPKEAAQIAAEAAAQKGINVSAEAFETVFERINFQIEFDYSVIEAIYETAQFLYEQGKIDKIPTLVYDQSFLEEAIKLRG
jgi:sulfonate transport system substrate-binding protein